MEINRRVFIGGVAYTFFSGLGFERSDVPKEENEMFASARRDKSGQCSAAIFDLQKGDITSVNLPARGHDIAVHPFRKEVIFFARRPGNFAVALPYNSKDKPYWFYVKPDRHFYGHGVFSPDGKLLYTTENDYENGRGIIGVRDVTNGYRQVGEFQSHGIGPHDLAFLSDAQTLVIANGGTETHPDMGRKILNISEMEPNLSYVDVRTGDLIEQHQLSKDLHQLSIRHLDVAKGDHVVFGCQYKGPKTDLPALMGFHRRGAEPVLVTMPKEELRAMRHYVGSVVSDKSGTVIAASSPKGGLVTFWDTESRSYLGSKKVLDCCGLAPMKKQKSFLLTNGLGDLFHIDKEKVFKQSKILSNYQWDNHAVSV